MKHTAIAVAGLLLSVLILAQAVHAEVNVNVNVGIPGPPVIALPAPPEFILPPALGFYVAVDVPFDIYFVGNTYYLYKDRGWYSGRHYNGPWSSVEYRQLPPGLRKHKHERIRHYRDEEYRRYRADHDQYRGKHFKPEKEWKEERKDQRREEKAQRKQEKQEQKHDKGKGGDKHGGHKD